MVGQERKVIVAFIISCLGIVGTQYYFSNDSSDRQFLFNQSDLLGHMTFTQNEVQKRPAKRIVWYSVVENEPLFAGEAIRTAPNSEARMYFSDSKGELILEPDSVVIVERIEKSINLDIVQGNFIIKNTGSSNVKGLTIKSGESKIHVSGGEAVFSKSSDQLQVDVQSGSAQYVGPQGSQIIDSAHSAQISKTGMKSIENRFIIETPSYFSTIPKIGSSKAKVQFKWKLKDGDSLKGIVVSIEIGKDFGGLRDSEFGSVDSGKSELSGLLEAGTYFWRLVAEDKLGKGGVFKGQLSKFKVVEIQAPILDSPENSANVVPDPASGLVTFQWSNPSRLGDMTLDISRNPKITELIESRNVGFLKTTAVKLSPGNYYWRVRAVHKDSGTVLATEINKVVLAGPDLLQTLTAKELPILQWVGEKNGETQTYSGTKPKLNLKWLKFPGAESYRLKITPNSQGVCIEKDSVHLEINTELPERGAYKVVVEALSVDKRIIARSNTRLIQINEFSGLAAPEFSSKSPQIFRASGRGRLKFSWLPVKGAKNYTVVLSNEKSDPVTQAKFQGTMASMANLLPGEYLARVSATDKLGRKGMDSESRRVVVPQLSDVRAPALKTFRVK